MSGAKKGGVPGSRRAHAREEIGDLTRHRSLWEGGAPQDEDERATAWRGGGPDRGEGADEGEDDHPRSIKLIEDAGVACKPKDHWAEVEGGAVHRDGGAEGQHKADERRRVAAPATHP